MMVIFSSTVKSFIATVLSNNAFISQCFFSLSLKIVFSQFADIFLFVLILQSNIMVAVCVEYSPEDTFDMLHKLHGWHNRMCSCFLK